MAFYQRLKDLKEDADLTQAEISEIMKYLLIIMESMSAEKPIYRFQRQSN